MPKDPIVSIPQEFLKQAQILSEALPYMRYHSGNTIVIKYGGHAMGDAKLSTLFARDIVLLKQVGIHPIIVHGGGPQIGHMLERLHIKSSFVQGLRVTDKETIHIVEMVLCGSINKEITALINTAGGKAIGLSGKDGGLIQARRLKHLNHDPEMNLEVIDLGFVGEPESINTDILYDLQKVDIIPVIAPVGISSVGETYNINADTVAGTIAGEIAASRLLLITDIDGVLDQNSQLLSSLSVEKASCLIASGVIKDGMHPKVQTCITALERGVNAAVIINGHIPHAILLELFTTSGIGTMIQQTL